MVRVGCPSLSSMLPAAARTSLLRSGDRSDHTDRPTIHMPPAAFQYPGDIHAAQVASTWAQPPGHVRAAHRGRLVARPTDHCAPGASIRPKI